MPTFLSLALDKSNNASGVGRQLPKFIGRVCVSIKSSLLPGTTMFIPLREDAQGIYKLSTSLCLHTPTRRAVSTPNTKSEIIGTVGWR